MIIEISGKRITVEHIPGPLGVRGRNSDNVLIKEKLGWAPAQPLKNGLAKTYPWVSNQAKRRAAGTR
jgi:nucleoside-diphosphate-sugar epimerase